MDLKQLRQARETLERELDEFQILFPDDPKGDQLREAAALSAKYVALPEAPIMGHLMQGESGKQWIHRTKTKIKQSSNLLTKAVAKTA